MGWARWDCGKGSVSSLVPFTTCGKGAIFEADKRKRCSKWVCAQRKPHLWTPERIVKSCNGCEYYRPEAINQQEDNQQVLHVS